MRHRIEEAVRQLRAWIDRQPSTDRSRVGEWESEYSEWRAVYAAADALLERPPESWQPQELDDLLFAIGGDNEAEYLAAAVARKPEVLLFVSSSATLTADHEAKWQLAAELSSISAYRKEAEAILLRLAADEDEYVQRRAMLALADLGSSEAESLALRHWHRYSGNEHALIAALSALHRVRSARLDDLVASALHDKRIHLARHAQRIHESDLGHG